MKTIALITSLMFSFSAFSEVICNDQNSHAVYEMNVAIEDFITLTPISKDSSLLSKAPALLEKQSETVFGGHNFEVTTRVMAKLNYKKARALKKGQILEVEVFVESEANAKNTYHTELLCSLN